MGEHRIQKAFDGGFAIDGLVVEVGGNKWPRFVGYGGG